MTIKELKEIITELDDNMIVTVDAEYNEDYDMWTDFHYVTEYEIDSNKEFSLLYKK